MDSTTRFGDRAADYARFRPSYPRALVEAMLDGFVAPDVADLGAGTGISAALLAACGARVYAVEPNAPMREAIAPNTAVTPLDATAEATTLADASVDVVTAFQAYHWFDADRVLRETARIARPRARFVAVWNERDLDDAFTAAYQRVIDRYILDDTERARIAREDTVDADLRRHGWSDVRSVAIRHERRLDWETLVGFSRSASYLPKTGAAYDAMVAELRALFASVPAGDARFVLLATAHIGERDEAALVE